MNTQYKQELVAYTDYPLLGIDGQKYKVKVVTYDRNKYVKVILSGITYEVKLGYIFKDADLTLRFTNFNELYALPKFDGGMRNTKMQVTRDLKQERKHKKTYMVCTESHVYEFKTFSSALRKVKALPKDIDYSLFKDTHLKYKRTYDEIFSRRNGNLIVIIGSKNRSVFKTNHYKLHLKG